MKERVIAAMVKGGVSQARAEKFWALFVSTLCGGIEPEGSAPVDRTSGGRAGEPVPVERTPETVLRAMLKAYEAAALEAAVVFHRAQKDKSSDTMTLSTFTVRAHQIVREMLAASIVNSDIQAMADRAQWGDYEARLSGAGPLDAPPLEES